jgi:hypothetical protein
MIEPNVHALIYARRGRSRPSPLALCAVVRITLDRDYAGFPGLKWQVPAVD